MKFFLDMAEYLVEEESKECIRDPIDLEYINKFKVFVNEIYEKYYI